jgi:hypothetical protein
MKQKKKRHLTWDEVIPIITKIGSFLGIMYLIGMLIVPLFSWNWAYIQRVWSHWQSLNVGVLAFTSTVIAFNISRSQAERQREREFIAARAFLPEALSELNEYTKKSAAILLVALNNAKGQIEHDSRVPRHLTPPLSPLTLPPIYKQVFSNCIRHAKPDMAEHLANILSQLQVHSARLSNLNNRSNRSSDILISYIFALGKLHAYIYHTFDSARGEAQFVELDLTEKDILSAYIILDIQLFIDEELKDYTSRRFRK